MASYILLEAGGKLELETGAGFVLTEQQVIVVGDYLVQEVDGTSRFTLEDGTGFILLESGVVPPPAPPETGGGAISVRRRLPGRTGRLTRLDDEAVALTILLRTIRKRTVRRDN